jgi:hypothetical protein
MLKVFDRLKKFHSHYLSDPCGGLESLRRIRNLLEEGISIVGSREDGHGTGGDVVQEGSRPPLVDMACREFDGSARF